MATPPPPSSTGLVRRLLACGSVVRRTLGPLPAGARCAVLTLLLLWVATAPLLLIRKASTFQLSITEWEKLMLTLGAMDAPFACVAWRGTEWCHAHGRHVAALDRSCRDIIKQQSGYCECAGGVTVAQVGCGLHSFSCFDRCRELGPQPSQTVLLPTLMGCSSGSYTWAFSEPAATNSSGFQLPERLTVLWERLLHSARMHHPAAVLPGKRTEASDWVFDDQRLSAQAVAALHDSFAAFRQEAPAAPAEIWSGRGIVMVGGGLKYMVSAWINIHLLRAVARCALPVELWFPLSEFPVPAMVAYLETLNVTCRPLAVPDLEQHGYIVKIAALLLSSFEEVLFLDADSFPVQDPAQLFESPQYQQHGAMLWQDYWASTSAPQLAGVLGIPAAAMPAESFESGQFLVNKRSHWAGLVSVLYMNLYHTLYYDLTTSYMGWGDKVRCCCCICMGDRRRMHCPMCRHGCTLWVRAARAPAAEAVRVRACPPGGEGGSVRRGCAPSLQVALLPVCMRGCMCGPGDVCPSG